METIMKNNKIKNFFLSATILLLLNPYTKAIK